MSETNVKRVMPIAIAVLAIGLITATLVIRTNRPDPASKPSEKLQGDSPFPPPTTGKSEASLKSSPFPMPERKSASWVPGPPPLPTKPPVVPAGPETFIDLEREHEAKDFYLEAHVLFIKKRDKEGAIEKFEQCLAEYSTTHYLREVVPPGNKTRIEIIKGWLQGLRR